MIPDGWHIYAERGPRHPNRWQWYVFTGRGFCFASTRTYASERGAKAHARKALGRFLQGYSEMP